jgi:methionine sulfoxide reductase heme-binding subunit
MHANVLDLSAYVGLAAVGAVTVNMLLGILMVFRYSPLRSWPHCKFNYFRAHDWCGYIALSASVLHPLILLFNNSPKFRFVDVIYPVHSPGKPVENAIGAVALYLTTLVVVTSYFRLQLGRRVWKAFHFAIYCGAAALFFHSLLTVPDMKSESVDWLDGGKVFIMSCLALTVTAGLLRWRHTQTRMKEAINAAPDAGPLNKTLKARI